jgi:hypothetical protein
MVKQLLILGDSFCHGIGTATSFKSSDNTQYAFNNIMIPTQHHTKEEQKQMADLLITHL